MFTRKELLPITREVDERGELPREVLEKFLKMELLKSAFPEAHGGAGGTFTGFIIALKELCYATPVPAWLLFENFLLAYSIHHYGSESMKKTYLPDLLSQDRRRPGVHRDRNRFRSRAVENDGEKNGWRLAPQRFKALHHPFGYLRSDDPLCEDRGPGDRFSGFSGEAWLQGRERDSFIHMKNLENGDLYLDDYFAPDEDVIGEVGQGFEILLGTETLGKVAFSSFFVGLAERALDLSIEYANTKTHRDRPIGHKFQMTQFKLAGMTARVEAMKAYLYHVSAKVDRGEDVFRDAATLKLLVAGDIKEVTANAMEIHGAYGLNNEFPIGTLYKAAISAQVVMGSLDIQRVIIAKSLLKKGSCR